MTLSLLHLMLNFTFKMFFKIMYFRIGVFLLINKAIHSFSSSSVPASTPSLLTAAVS